VIVKSKSICYYGDTFPLFSETIFIVEVLSVKQSYGMLSDSGPRVKCEVLDVAQPIVHLYHTCTSPTPTLCHPLDTSLPSVLFLNAEIPTTRRDARRRSSLRTRHENARLHTSNFHDAPRHAIRGAETPARVVHETASADKGMGLCNRLLSTVH
jgi:hypothetical protein